MEKQKAIDMPHDFHGRVKWESPSNIALVKYWGKKGVQLPQNPSVSFTLSQCKTETAVQYAHSERFSMRFYFDGKENQPFASKINRFLLDNLGVFPWLNHLEIRIESRNTFPHSSGIASSASSMSALVMCLLDIEKELTQVPCLDYRRASCLSRLASGSAARSVFPKMALWGETSRFPGSSDEYAVPLGNEIHPIFKTYRDSILIVSDAAKAVSSRAGHSLMENHPYASARYRQANANTIRLLEALKTGDLATFVQITESEALQLHALMMGSTPSFILMQANTLNLIQAIRQFRETKGVPVCFTLDAGPNVHLLYPEQDAETVASFIESQLAQYCHEARWIKDRVGEGPNKLL